MSLQKLIKPNSVAIVGVSERPGKFGHSAVLNIRKSSVKNAYYVHPNRETVFGQKCFRSLAELPEVVDCVVICTPAQTVNPILTLAGEMGIQSGVVFASGFSEEGEKKAQALEEKMIEICTRFRMKVLGPNCLGVYNATDDIYLWGMDSEHIPTENITGIGVAAQSGWVVETFIDTDYTDIAYGLSSGNGNIVTLEECLEFMVDQDSVKVVALYLEGLKRPDIFIRALKIAAEKRKPIVVLKGGRSALGAASAASHTGNLAGSSEAFECVFKKYGVIAVDDFDQLITMSHTLNILGGRLPEPPSYGGIALSGGENTLFADLGTAAGLILPPYTAETKARLKAHIPEFATPHNPCDTTTHLFFREDAIVGVLKAVDADPGIGGIFLSVNIDQDEHPMWRHFCEAVSKAKGECTKPVFAIPASEGCRNANLRKLLEGAGVPLMASPSTSIKCLRYIADFAQYRYQDRMLVQTTSANSGHASTPIPLTEAASKEELANYGIPTPAQFVVTKPDDIGEALRRLRYPLALKINSADILHKTDVGGVRLNIRSEAEAMEAFDEIIRNIKRTVPQARLNGVLFEEMVPQGVEIILGINNAPQLGPMLLVGLGGVFVEIFKDTVLYPVPINKFEAMEMLKQLKAYKILSGYRGSPPCDTDALTDLMIKISEYAYQNRDSLKELDLNPVFVYPEGNGAIAVDALIVRYPDP